MKVKNKNTKLYWRILIAYIVVAILAPVIANERPLYISIGGKSYFPALSGDPYIIIDGEKQLMNSIDWKNLPAESKIFAPVRWSPRKSDLTNSFTSPFEQQFKVVDGKHIPLNISERHFLGTGKLGNDTLADLIHGTRVSVFIGLMSMLIAVCIGVILGSAAGYFGDYTLRVSRLQILSAILFIIPAWFYAFSLRLEILKSAFNASGIGALFHLFLSLLIFIAIVAIPFLLLPGSKKKNIYFPLDNLVSRLIELIVILPRLILILTIAAVFRASLVLLIILISFSSWTEFARISRARLLQMKQLNFIEAARATGMNNRRMFFTHIIPNIKDQVFSLAIYGMAGAIVMETGLSYLGVGLNDGTTSWGEVMFEARQKYTAWWLVLFSGITISGLLYSLYALSKNSQVKNSEHYSFETA